MTAQPRERDSGDDERLRTEAREAAPAAKENDGAIETLSPEHACGFGLRAAPSSGPRRCPLRGDGARTEVSASASTTSAKPGGAACLRRRRAHEEARPPAGAEDGKAAQMRARAHLRAKEGGGPGAAVTSDSDEARKLRDYVGGTEVYIQLMLDEKQTRLLQTGVILTTATVVVTAGIVVVSLFGMNIHIDLMKDPETPEMARIKDMKFWETTWGTVAGCAAIYFLLIYAGKKSKYLK